MEGSSADERMGFSPGFGFDGVGGLTGDTVGVGKLEPTFVFGARFQIEDGASEAIGYGIVEILTAPENVFAANTEKREALAPLSLTGLPVLNGDGGVTIGVALDRPLEAEVQKRWRLDVEAPCTGRVLGKKGTSSKQEG